MTLNETTSWLSTKTIKEKILFNELLLPNMTVMNRLIWENPGTTDKVKVESLKWSNELAHRIWNTLFALKRGDDDSSEKRLADNINFYKSRSDELAEHLAFTVKTTVDRYLSLIHI